MSNEKINEDQNELENGQFDIIEKQFEKIEELFEIKILTPDNCKFIKSGGSFLSLEVGDEKYSKVTIYRTFPFSEPDRYLSIRQATPKAEEIGIIKDLDSWPENIREIVEEQLNLRYFTPVIKKINDIKEEYGFAYWTVITDKGEMNFTTSIWSPITRISENRLLVSDLDANRFEIENFEMLSKKEKKLIDLFL